MIYPLTFRALVGFFLINLAATTPGEATSHGKMIGNLEIRQAWARATPPGTKNGVAFMVIFNHGMSSDKLTTLSSKASEKTELHKHTNDNGVMRMRQVAHIEIPKLGQVILKSGSYHIMFIGLKTAFKEGDMVMIKLNFEKAGTITLHVPIKKDADMPKGDIKRKHKHN